MGYNTYFDGRVEVVPPLDAEEITYLKKFNGTRRMLRAQGPYFVEGSGSFGQGHDSDIQDYNRPSRGQPSLWCGWVPTDDGKYIEWDESENFSDSVEWMEYLIEHFLREGCRAKGIVPGIRGGHVLNGKIHAEGEEQGDVWDLIVKDNKVRERTYRLVADEEE